MRRILWLFYAVLLCGLLPGCGAVASNNPCVITASVMPASATADHSATPPGNQVQFVAQGSATGNCPLTPDRIGSWATSDPANTTISNQPPTAGLATCVHVAPIPASISYSGSIRGHAFTTATLNCN
jgi:hypothetical protein